MEVLTHPHLDKQIQRISARRTVGTEADGHAVLMHQGHRCHAFCGLRVGGDAVGHGRAVLREDLHVTLRCADAVGRQRIRSEDADMFHELDRCHAVLFF